MPMLLRVALLLLSERIIFLECHPVHHTVETPPAISITCHIVSQPLSCHLFNLRCALQKQGLSSSPAPRSQRTSRGESALLVPAVTLHHTAAQEPFAGAGKSTD